MSHGPQEDYHIFLLCRCSVHGSVVSIAGTFVFMEVMSRLTNSSIFLGITVFIVSHIIFVDEFILHSETTANQSTTFSQLCVKQNRTLTTLV